MSNKEKVIACVREFVGGKLQEKWKDLSTNIEYYEVEEITLADVLMAIDSVDYSKRRTINAIALDGTFKNNDGEIGVQWNISKNLEEQPPEVFDFLLTVLEK